jgi:hypothetical protein
LKENDVEHAVHDWYGRPLFLAHIIHDDSSQNR